jgi:hypothetical protein
MGESWVGVEMQTLDLGDTRRERRVGQMIKQLFANPGASVPKACGSAAETKAAYRALGSEEVLAAEIRRAHAQATVQRAQEHAHVLVLQDTSSAAFSTRPGIEGLGPLEKKGLRGLFLHTGLLVTPEGLPLGILEQQVWARDEEETGKRHTRRARPIEEKESFRWLEMVDAVESLLPKDQEVWIVGDREADIFELLAMERRPGLHLIVRATHDRCIESEHGTHLLGAVQGSEVLGEMEVEVPRSRKREARRGKLQVQACTVKLPPPQNLKDRKSYSPVMSSVVRVVEKETTPEGEEPIEWMIFSTRPVRTLEQAVKVVEAYAQRWKVERYHYVLKSGCGVEDLQLESADRIERAIAIFNVVAWRLLYMTYIARIEPNQPCTAVLEEEEWRLLYVVSKKMPPPEAPPTVREVVRMIAQLGGFLARKGDGEPGVKTLWSGFRRLMDFVYALHALRFSPGLVGNG